MIKATKFIKDYHLYGRLPNYSIKSTQISNNIQKIENLSRNPSLHSKKESNLSNSLARSKKYDNYENLEIKNNLKNLRLGQKEYMQKYQTKTLKNIYS